MHPKECERQESRACTALRVTSNRVVQQLALALQPVGPMISRGKPEQNRIAATMIVAIGVIEKQPGGSAGKGRVSARCREARRLRQTKVAAEHALQLGDQENVEGCAIGPIAGP